MTSPPDHTAHVAAGNTAGLSTERARPLSFRLDPTEHPDPLLTAASVAGNGWPVLAIRPGSKAPLHHGAGDNHRAAWLSTPAEVVTSAEEYAGTCWECRCPGFAALTGQPGRGLADGRALVCLDHDGGDLAALLAEAGPEAEEWAAETLRVQRCGERGHLWGTAPAADVPTTGRLADGLEWRGLGGYVLLPGSLHPSGARYAITAGRVEFTEGHAPAGAIYRGVTDPDPAPCVAWAYPLPVPEALLAVVSRRLGPPDDGGRPPLRLLTGGAGDLSPGAARLRLAGVLSWLGAAEVGERNDRLNKAAGLAAGLLARVPEAERVDDLAPEVWRQAVTEAGVTLGLDRREAERTTASGWGWGAEHPAEDHPAPGAAASTVVILDPDPPTFVDLSALREGGTLPPPPRPEYLHRADGHALLYRGTVNRLFGDYESGKTWVVIAAAAEVLTDGGRVAHLDADAMGWRAIVRRLSLLGVALDVLADPDRFRIAVPEDAGHLRRVIRDVSAWAPDLAGLDSFAGLLALLRKSRNNPDDAAEAALVLRPLAESGACVVLLDHLAQSAESRRSGPSGTLEKGREVRGVSLRVEVVRQYRPGAGGASRLSVEKDTPGGVREHLPETKGRREPVAGVFRLAPVGEDPAAPGSLRWAVDSPTPADLTTDDAEVIDERAEVEAAVKLSGALAGGWLSQTKARQAAKVGKSKVAPVLARLAAGGYVESRSGERGAVEWRSVKPFTEADELPEAVGDDDA